MTACTSSRSVTLPYWRAGVLYGVEENGQGGAAFNQQLLTLNPANGATLSVIGNLGAYNVEDISYAPDREYLRDQLQLQLIED